VTDAPEPMEPAEASPDRPLIPGEVLTKLFLDNADRGANAANDELVSALRQRVRAVQALAPRLPETTAL
jgi:hypothetical protein